MSSVPYTIRRGSQELKHRYGEVFPSYNKITFHKEEARREAADFVAPGHPLLEALIERIFSDFCVGK